MDIGSLRFADFNGAFCTGVSPPVPLFTKRQYLRLQTKCDYKSNRHRKHHTNFEQVFSPSDLAAKQQRAWTGLNGASGTKSIPKDE
jgi:hypothetical protein